MIKILEWLGRNRVLTVLLGIVVYFSIVAFHDEVTTLAIRLRNAIGRDKYNDYLAWGFLLLLLYIITILIYQSIRSRQRYLNLILSFIVTVLIVFSFKSLMVYSIEAIHFVEYMLVAIILFPALRSYGETVFWVTILGILDELFQYKFLTPNFEYFDFNDITLNSIGAGAGAVLVFVIGSKAVKIRKILWYRSPAILTSIGLIAIFSTLVLAGKMSIDPVNIPGYTPWFSLNRKSIPDQFWTTAYPGRVFHILRPYEGIALMVVLLTGFSMLDACADKLD